MSVIAIEKDNAAFKSSVPIFTFSVSLAPFLV